MRLIAFAATAALLPAGISTAATTVLYDGAGTQTPSDQGWQYITNPPFGADASASASAGLTTLDTTGDRGESAGYFTHNPITGSAAHPSAPILDRTTGFTLTFDLAILEEGHDTVNRGGFSVIVVTSDQRAIELAFWTSEVWAYSFDGSAFTHGEGVGRAASLLDDLTRYDLTVLGDTYDLAVGGASLLAGDLRDYTAWPGVEPFPGFVVDPYDKPNMVFLGDDTSSADSRTQLGYVAVTPLPEPATSAMLLLTALGVAQRRRRPRTGAATA